MGRVECVATGADDEVALGSCVGSALAGGGLQATTGGLLVASLLAGELTALDDEGPPFVLVELGLAAIEEGRADLLVAAGWLESPCDGGLLDPAPFGARTDAAPLVLGLSVSWLPVNFFGAAGGSGNLERRGSAD